MLDPKQNTIDYGESLVPPEGYELSYAIGTTYSLDLEALLVLPVALFYSETFEVKKGDIRYDMIESITQASKKITVYCQNGKVAVPPKYNFLFSYWEKGIEYITMPSAHQSFHPKVWVIRYEFKDDKKKPAKYKMLITSRNLTYARDWDVAFTSEGEVEKEKVERTKPIADFMRHIIAQGKRQIPEEFIGDLEKVDFEIPDDFDKINFLPIGFGSYTNPLGKKTWDELLVISPFVDKTTVDNFVKNSEKKISICSRKEELDGLPVETIQKCNAYQFNSLIEQGEFNEGFSEDDSDEPLQQNLHAKLYIAKKNNKVFWYLGSANATMPALERNTEYLVELSTTNLQLEPKRLIKQLVAQDYGESTDEKSKSITLFEKYNIENRKEVTEEKKEEIALRELVYKISKLQVKGQANKRPENDVYDLLINVDARSLFIDKYSIKLRPLSAIQNDGALIKAGEENAVDIFKDFNLTQLSPYIIWEIWEGSECKKDFMVLMEVDLFDDLRLKKIFIAIIDSKEKFLRYLTFLLTGEGNEVITENVLSGSESKVLPNQNPDNLWNIPGVPVYEKLLLAASRLPDRLYSINELIERLKLEQVEEKEPIITKEFESFWIVFRNFLEKNHARKN